MDFDLAPEDHELTAAQIAIMNQTLTKVKETIQRLTAEHRELHSTVSKVGKAIDRVISFYYYYIQQSFYFKIVIWGLLLIQGYLFL